MNLISRNNCGVVLDKSKLKFPTDVYNYDGSFNDNLVTWDSDSRSSVTFVNCPVCGEQVLGDKC